MEPKADIALIGLAVMGQNLILNMNDHGFTVVAFNRTVSKVDDFLNHEAKGTEVIGAQDGRRVNCGEGLDLGDRTRFVVQWIRCLNETAFDDARHVKPPAAVGNPSR